MAGSQQCGISATAIRATSGPSIAEWATTIKLERSCLPNSVAGVPPKVSAGKIWGYLLDCFIGYGYQPWLAAIWLVALVTMGSIVFAWRPPPPLDPATSQHFNSLVYTIY